MNQVFKAFLNRAYWLLSAQFGIDPRATLRSLQGMPRYLRDYARYRSGYAGRMEWVPCLHDWNEDAGVTGSEYFWQDLLVARMIFEARPERHVDIGSRVDGFVAHVASFRDLEVLDVRPVTARIPGVTFKQADLMKPMEGMAGYCDSLSCLHALEHFGLGRYGDPIDPAGFERGLANLAQLLRKGGVFYLSVPIGNERVEFNANRVLDPRIVVKQAVGNSLELRGLTVIRQGSRVEVVAADEAHLSELAGERYVLGIFTLVRTI